MMERQKRPLVLVADDEEVIRELLRRRLAADGYEVETAEDGEEAVAVVGRGAFVNVVLSDIKMPGLDGIEVLKRTKAASPDTEVIIMTAYASTDTAIDAVRLGAYDYLQKPFDHIDDVSHKVKLALRQQRLEIQNREMVKKLDEMNRGLKQVVISRTKELNETHEAARQKEDALRQALRRREQALAEVPGRVRDLASAIEAQLPALPAGPAGEIARALEGVRAEVARLVDPALADSTSAGS